MEVKTLHLTNQSLDLEARVVALQNQLDRAYEEIADKDTQITKLENQLKKIKVFLIRVSYVGVNNISIVGKRKCRTGRFGAGNSACAHSRKFESQPAHERS